MRHGAHCRVRSFPTKCRKCGAPVFYWECSHGIKVFFNFPIYGKAIRHICQIKKKSKSQTIKSFSEHRSELLEKSSYQCPVCGKIMVSENSLMSHIQKMKKQDDYHADFFDNALDLINFKPIEEEENQERKKSWLDKFQTNHLLESNGPRYRIKATQKEKFKNFLNSKEDN